MRRSGYTTIQQTGKDVKLLLLIGRLLFWTGTPMTLLGTCYSSYTTCLLATSGVCFLGLILIGLGKIDRWWQNY